MSVSSQPERGRHAIVQVPSAQPPVQRAGQLPMPAGAGSHAPPEPPLPEPSPLPSSAALVLVVIEEGPLVSDDEPIPAGSPTS
jgi:hypothetical protein